MQPAISIKTSSPLRDTHLPPRIAFFGAIWRRVKLLPTLIFDSLGIVRPKKLRLETLFIKSFVWLRI